jgi:hypothetical protein
MLINLTQVQTSPPLLKIVVLKAAPLNQAKKIADIQLLFSNVRLVVFPTRVDFHCFDSAV